MKKYIHTPFKGGSGGVKLGLEPIEEPCWLEVDTLFIKEIEKKRELFNSNKNKVFQAIDESQESQIELLRYIKNYLSEYYSDNFTFEENRIQIEINGETLQIQEDPLKPLETSSFLVQEDLLLMLPDANNSYRLGAASLCAPSNWSLTEKFKKSLLGLHAGVPGYKEKISRRVNKIFSRLEEDRIFERFNWSIYDNPSLFQPKKSKSDVTRRSDLKVNDAGDKLFIRVERQTIRRLPISHAVIFTVRVHVYPLSSIKDDLNKLTDLRLAIENLPKRMKRYKALDQIEKPILGWLEERIVKLG